MNLPVTVKATGTPLTPHNFTANASAAARIYRDGGAVSLAVIRAANGDVAQNGGTHHLGLWRGGTDVFVTLGRIYLTFDTSAVTSGGIVTSATLRVRQNSGGGSGLDTCALSVMGLSSAPAAENTYAASDFQKINLTSNYGSIAWPGDADQWLEFTLNASGLAAISKTGYSHFVVTTVWDQSNVYTGNNTGISTTVNIALDTTSELVVNYNA